MWLYTLVGTVAMDARIDIDLLNTRHEILRNRL
jgi:hypothetical protein